MFHGQNLLALCLIIQLFTHCIHHLTSKSSHINISAPTPLWHSLSLGLVFHSIVGGSHGCQHSLQFWPESSEIPSIIDGLPTKGKCGRWKSEICPVEYVEPMLTLTIRLTVGQLKFNWSLSEATRTHVLVLTDGDPISLSCSHV